MCDYSPERIHRILFKISGEFLAGGKSQGFDHDTIEQIVADIIEVKRMGVSIGIVLGGGNIFRGVSEANETVRRIAADNVGMLATVQNSIILAEYLRVRNYPTVIYSAIQIDRVSKFYAPERAEASLNEGKICLFCAGTGNPFFTTDTAAVLRAVELGAHLMLKGTKVDGVFTADPQRDDKAEFIPDISFDDVLNRQLNVMDMTAFSLAREAQMPVKVFNVTRPGMLKQAILKRDVGTFVHP
ncbi:MAG: UMP kinase [Candidatus Cloacimonetes bacterium]|nr:UMP kinase [Candidatus Cloacimonadota bacterium]